MLRRLWALVCAVSALLVILFTTGHAFAVAGTCGMVSGAVTAGDPTQTGRIGRNGIVSICGTAKGLPASTNIGARNFDVYHFDNNSGASACYSFTLTTPGNILLLVAYSAFNPADVTATYVGDSGDSTTTQNMALTVANGTGIDVVVHALSPGDSDTYTLTATGCFVATASVSVVSSGANPTVVGQSATFTATVTGNGAAPTGTVTFFDGATNLGSGAVDGAGHAALTTGAVAVGTRSITAQYGGDSTYSAVTSSAITHTVNKASTTTTIVSAPNPQDLAQPVTFTATVSVVAPGAGSPTGTVTFFDGGTSLGTGMISAGQASLITSALGGGSHSITATYGGDSSFTGSSSSALTQAINRASSAIVLSTAPNPSTFGASVTMQATVSASVGGTPTGSVTFREGATILGAANLVAGVASISPASLAVGNHSISANYAGDTNHNPVASAAVAQVVNKLPTMTALTSSANPSVVGQTTTLTAIVTAATTTPAGIVTFTDDTTVLGMVALNGSGAASLDVANLAAGTHPIVATYSGSATLATSFAADLMQTVAKASTTTTIISSSSPTVGGASVTFTATVHVTSPGSGTPGGNVTFKEGATVLATVALTAGSATFDTSTLAIGSHDIVVSYEGNANFLSSTSPAVTQVVNQSGVTVALTVSPTSSAYGQNALFTATLSATTGGIPTGVITFKEGTAVLGTGTLSAGSATFVTAVLGVGAHAIRAEYGGDANHVAGSAGTVQLVVSRRNTTTALASSPNPSVVDQEITLTANVTVEPLGGDAGAAGGGLSPLTGTVIFSDGLLALGSVALTNGTAALTTTSLTVGAHALSAAYDGTANYGASASTQLAQAVLTSADAGNDAAVAIDSGPPSEAGASDGGNANDATLDRGPISDGSILGAKDSSIADASGVGASADQRADAPDTGCSCRVTTTGRGSGMLGLSIALLGILASRRRQRRVARGPSTMRPRPR